ncbi:MAG: beta-ketoacyl-ACP synthase III [bacterium]
MNLLVKGIGSALPPKRLTNFDLEKIVDTSDEWIRTRTGISERRITEKETTSDLAVEAARKALEAAETDPMEVELIVVGTVTADMMFPSCGCMIQEAIGAKNSVAFDVSAACSGFVFALSAAESYLRAGIYGNALVVGADTLTKYLDWEDRNTCILFGDGAGAVFLQAEERNDNRGLISSRINTDGAYGKMLYLPGGGSSAVPSVESVARKAHCLSMKGREVFKLAVKYLSDSVKTILAENQLTLEELDLFIPHQANERIMRAVAENLSLPWEKVVNIVSWTGNSSSSTIPLALDQVNREGRLTPGTLVVLSAFGGGASWGSALIRW